MHKNDPITHELPGQEEDPPLLPTLGLACKTAQRALYSLVGVPKGVVGLLAHRKFHYPVVNLVKQCSEQDASLSGTDFQQEALRNYFDPRVIVAI